MKQSCRDFLKNSSLLFLRITITYGLADPNNMNFASEAAGSSYFFYHQPQYPRDCQEVYNQCSITNSSGVYLIKPDGYPDAFEVYCDNIIDGGGWTVFHRRTEGAIDFHRTWLEYEGGFGFLNSEMWIGLKRLSFLTNQKEYEIRIDMENSAGSSFYIQYNDFRISDDKSGYRLTDLGPYSGTADAFILSCPPNMVYGNCTCQATCEDPEISTGCQTTCGDGELCICREGFLKKGDQCVSPEECSCFIEGQGVVPSGQTQVNVDCTIRCQCHSNILTCDNNYRCSSDATCEERDGVRQCYCNDGYTGDGQNCEVVATDCADIYNAGITDSGVYTIKPREWPGPPFEVYCNMTDGGGWTVFQRRVNGSQDFYLGWDMYKDGFGLPNHELWLGNDKLYYMTNNKNYQLKIDMVDRDGSPYYANYGHFRISNENDGYKLVGLSGFSGTAGQDALAWHINKAFSTHDRDNDGWNAYNCAERQRGAWWFGQGRTRTSPACRTHEDWCNDWSLSGDTCGDCTRAHLNGDYHSSTRGTNIHWEGLNGYNCNIAYTEMKIKPV